MPTSLSPDLTAIRAAAIRIAPYVHRTPLHTSHTLNDALGLEAWFKCENFQKVGAFKARGAVHAVLRLPDDQAVRGVVTHSSGNHAQALAYAASIRGIPCTVVMPDDASSIKLDAVRGYGAQVVLCARPDRERKCREVAEATGAHVVHPYDDSDIIAGQGTAALELLECVPDLDAVIAPVGGGGLLAGTAVVVRTLREHARIIGAEPAGADDARRSLETGVLQPAPSDPRTLADGLLTGLGERNFEILRTCGAEVTVVSDAAIVEAGRFHLFRMKLVVEPSAATGLAALRHLAPELQGRRVGVILSGGNTDFRWLCRSLDEEG